MSSSLGFHFLFKMTQLSWRIGTRSPATGLICFIFQFSVSVSKNEKKIQLKLPSISFEAMEADMTTNYCIVSCKDTKHQFW